MKATRFITIFILMALIAASFSLVAAANPPIPTPGFAIVDGDYSEWDWEIPNDFDYFADLVKNGGASGPPYTKLATLYLRYQCPSLPDTPGTLYALMLADYPVLDQDDEVFIKVDGVKVVDPTEPGSSEFAWVNYNIQDQTSDGWEASAPVSSGNHKLIVHSNVWEGGGSQTAQTIVPDIDLAANCFDYGDLPDTETKFTGYTLYASGANHEKGDLYLGASINTEVDGKPGEDADLDEFDDGIVPIGNWGDGTGHVQVTVTGDGCLYGWFDFNNDGNTNDPDYSFGDIGEEIISGEMVYEANNPTVLNFNLPENEIQGNYYARFRFFETCDSGESLAADLPPYQGPAVNGEVEDYFWTFGTNAVSMAGFSASTEGVPTIWIAVAALLSLAGITVFAWIRRRTI